MIFHRCSCSSGSDLEPNLEPALSILITKARAQLQKIGAIPEPTLASWELQITCVWGWVQGYGDQLKCCDCRV